MKIKCAEEYDVPEDATLVIDGQALVMSIGRPQMSHTFEDFATVFLKGVHQYGLPFTRIDVVFDRYDRLSIKEGTWTNRKKGKPIRRVIGTPDVPLPQDWQGFLSDPRNNADLTNFLSHELLRRAPAKKMCCHCWWASWGHNGAMQHARSRYVWYYQYSLRGRYPPCASLCAYAIPYSCSSVSWHWCCYQACSTFCYDQQGDIYEGGDK